MGKGYNKPTPVKLVSPVQQVVDQAKAEIFRERKGIKRSSSSPQCHSKRKTPRGKTSVAHSKAKKKQSRPKKTKSVTKKTPQDIFNNK